MRNKNIIDEIIKLQNEGVKQNVFVKIADKDALQKLTTEDLNFVYNVTMRAVQQ